MAPDSEKVAHISSEQRPIYCNGSVLHFDSDSLAHEYGQCRAVSAPPQVCASDSFIVACLDNVRQVLKKLLFTYLSKMIWPGANGCEATLTSTKMKMANRAGEIASGTMVYSFFQPLLLPLSSPMSRQSTAETRKKAPRKSIFASLCRQ